MAGKIGVQEVVRGLIDAGANPKLENVSGETALSLAGGSNHLGIFSTVLAVQDADGGLAEKADGLNFDFKATVIDFVEESGNMKPYAAEHLVADLLQNTDLPGHPGSATPSFRWLHLPANNASRGLAA